jgi:hypothetical protein
MGTEGKDEQGRSLVTPSVLKVHIMTRPYRTERHKKWKEKRKNITDETLTTQINSEFNI